MASPHSYTITTENNKSEKEAVAFLLESDSRFINPDKESRKVILTLLGVNTKNTRAFDLVLIPGHNNLEKMIELKNVNGITLIELKTTKKKLPRLPSGFFFGATESEFTLAKQLGSNYKFCFVSLHAETRNYVLLTLDELNGMIKTKRIQYQINL